MPINSKALTLTKKVIPRIEQLLQTKDFQKTKTLAKEVYEALDWYQQNLKNPTVINFFNDLKDYQNKHFDDITFYMCLDTLIRVLRIATFDEADTWWQSTFQKTLEKQYTDSKPEKRVPEMLRLLEEGIQKIKPI